MPCDKIDKPLVGKHYDVYNNVAYITIFNVFTADMRFQSNLNVI